MKPVLSLAALIVLLTAAVQPALADADPHYRGFLFVNPDGASVNATVNVTLETFSGVAHSDPDVVRMWVPVANKGRLDLTVMRVAPGHYASSFVASPSAFPGQTWTGSVRFNATWGAVSAEGSTPFYVFRPFVNRQTEVSLRLIEIAGSPVDGNRAALAGESFTVELQARDNGSLTDARKVSASYGFYEGDSNHSYLASNKTSLNGTHVSVGVWRYRVETDPNAERTRSYYVSGMVETSSTPHGSSSTGTGLTVTVHPFPFLLWYESRGPTWAAVQVLAGGAAPMADAEVVATGTFRTRSVPAQPVDFGSSTTDSHGWASLLLTWREPGYYDVWINISKDGKVATASIMEGTAVGDSPAWTPSPPAEEGFSIRLQTEQPQTVHTGDTMRPTLRATWNATALQRTDLLVYVYSYGSETPGVLAVVNATTDDEGNITFEWQVPAWWSYGYIFYEADRASTGDRAWASTWGWRYPDESDPAPVMPVPDTITAAAAAERAGTRVPVSARYGGTKDPAGSLVFVRLMPLPSSYWDFEGRPPSGVLHPGAEPGLYEGYVDVPAWYPQGDYWVISTISNAHLDPKFDDRIFASNVTTIFVGGPTAPPDAGGDPSGATRAAPGFEAVTALIAACAVATVCVRTRRR